MNKFLAIIISFILGFVIALLLYKVRTPDDTIIVNTYDSTEYSKYYKPIPISIDLPDTVTTVEYINNTIIKDSIVYVDSSNNIVIDTHNIIKDYLSMVKYDTIIINDSDLYIRVKSNVFANKLYSQSVNYKIRRPTTIVNNYYSKDFKVSGGVSTLSDFKIGLGYNIRNSDYITLEYSKNINNDYTAIWLNYEHTFDIKLRL
ncbi:MAG: hypothetical protein ACOCZ5_01625 [bacterium]